MVVSWLIHGKSLFFHITVHLPSCLHHSRSDSQALILGEAEKSLHYFATARSCGSQRDVDPVVIAWAWGELLDCDRCPYIYIYRRLMVIEKDVHFGKTVPLPVLASVLARYWFEWVAWRKENGSSRQEYSWRELISAWADWLITPGDRVLCVRRKFTWEIRRY